MSGKVTSIRIDGNITKELLIELGTDPDLEGFIIVCRWKGDRISAGWSDQKDQELIYGSFYLESEIRKEMFG